jgi:carbon-monoxide dehydrogenase catalytic subunit
MICNTCDFADQPLMAFAASVDAELAQHRVLQQDVKCGFGLQGVCCRLCANGPCRVTPEAPRGVCGADADTIVARNFLRSVGAGAACYIHIVENTALNLRNTARAKGVIKGEKPLDRLCEKLGVSGRNLYEKAEKLAESVLNDLHKPEYEKMQLVEKLAYGPRFDNWRRLGILPGGAKGEVFAAMVKSSTNLNSDPADMLTDCLRLGICTGLYGLVLTNLLNDILLGEPVIRPAGVGLKTINPDYINIMITGHQHSIFAHLQERLSEPDVTEKAKKAGAKGFRLVGCTCVGQDLQLRGAHYQQIFSGHAGNNFTSELVLSTGAIDAVLSEFNCTLPGIEPICDALGIKQICLDIVAKKKNAAYKGFDFATREQLSEEIIDAVIENYTERRSKVKINIPTEHGNDDTLTGISEVSLKEFLGDSWQPLIDLIAAGKIKGIAGVVGCSNLTAGGHDVLTVELTKELIVRDIIVLSAGCSSGGLENCGLMSPKAAALAGPRLRAVCESLGIPPVLNFGPCLAIGRLEAVATEIAEALGIDIPQLPLVMSAPQWLEEQALADGCFALALGMPLHLGLPPFVTGSPVAVQVLTETMTSLTGGHLFIEPDAKKAAEQFEAIIEKRREGLHL